MGKAILKESIIVILLLIIAVLLIKILFYDYNPEDKIVPVKVKAYNMPEEIEQELDTAIIEEQNIVRTYAIESSDLYVYESTNDYDKGKANPFADYTINTTNTSNGSNTEGNTSNDVDDKTSNSYQNEEQNKNEVYINSPGKNY